MASNSASLDMRMLLMLVLEDRVSTTKLGFGCDFFLEEATSADDDSLCSLCSKISSIEVFAGPSKTPPISTSSLSAGSSTAASSLTLTSFGVSAAAAAEVGLVTSSMEGRARASLIAGSVEHTELDADPAAVNGVSGWVEMVAFVVGLLGSDDDELLFLLRFRGNTGTLPRTMYRFWSKSLPLAALSPKASAAFCAAALASYASSSSITSTLGGYLGS
mmetsp:Transcript_7618/g.18348  ORF Transcript_7618/g.18348 Transcript_7618/m.18348 type:complete len:218 (+) Transcript_7618:1693-2346(+)